ncbi:SH3 domain-containing protein [Aequorivita marisscotiae]|uniref:SH3 domain-containing protein n=1 Tax=Aequorivita marisscotiae TaxID=3040348 RepID=A0ABY8L028_9FLAO|nr:SH3 domain-containing protein [Aequorivita sp. Ant34-E75]WGF93547.1 SH3 domain-containing protein [Aequorivita sp. Ant34-E75]
MKTVAFSVLALACFTFLFSCKNDAKTTDEAQTVAADSIPAETAPDAMYVTAVSGLTLREFPNLQSAKLAVMPLGTKVKIINAEGKTTMNVGGIDGAMDKVEFNNQKGFAFNGFLSKFFPPGENASAEHYAEELKKDFPKVSYSEATGGTASKPTKTETLLLPTDKWHEAFFTAQQLFNIPKVFAFPNPKGSNNETQQNGNKKKTDFVSELQITRNNNDLQKIVYNYKTTGFGYTITITKEAEGMKLEKVEVVD